MTVGENIRKIRKAKNMTQKELGAACNPPISESTLRQYELGLRNPKIETLKKIAMALHVSVDSLTSEKETPETYWYEQTQKLLKNYDKELSKVSYSDPEYDKKISAIKDQYKSLQDNISKTLFDNNPGKILQQLRINNGLSINQLAQKTGLSPILIKRYETNERIICLSDLCRLSKFYGVDKNSIDPIVSNDLERKSLTIQDQRFKKINDLYEQLNDEGQQKATELLELLSKIPEYQEPEPEEDDPTSD